MPRLLVALIVLLSHGCLLVADVSAVDLYPAENKGRTGYINHEGKVLIPFLFEDGRDFSQGLAAVLIDGKWGYINDKAEIVIAPFYRDAGDLSDGLACVRLKGKYGYINRKGKIVIEPLHRNAGTFSEGFAVVADDRGRTTLIDASGKPALNPDVYGMEMSGFSEGLVFGYAKDNRFPVYMDTDGKIAIRIETKDLDGFVVQGRPFSDGFAAVRAKGDWGFIDRTGKMVIAPEYWKVTPFQQGLAIASVMKTEDHVGRSTDYIIDRNGTRIRQLPSTSGILSEGLIPFGIRDKAKQERLYGYMNVRGETVIPPQFHNALPFRRGLARVQVRGASAYADKHEFNAYVDKQGRPVWIGEDRRDDRVASYSGKSMIDLYTETLKDEDWRLAHFYVRKMNRAELVEGSRITLDWLLRDPKRMESTDVGRSGTIGMAAIAPFLQTYSRSFLRDGKPIDASPFRSMLLDKSLDIDFRRELANCYRHRSFYTPSWEQIAADTGVFSKLARDPVEEERLRSEAVQSGCELIFRLYQKLRRETIADNAPGGEGSAKYPNIVGMLDRTPCPFTPAHKARWELLANCMEMAATDVVKFYGEARTPRARRTILALSKQIPDYHLLRDRELLKRVAAVTTVEEGARTKNSGPKGN